MRYVKIRSWLSITRHPRLWLLGLALLLLCSTTVLIIGILVAAPGDMLYPLGRQLDRIWFSLSRSPAARTRSYLNLAHHQIGDLELAIVNAPQTIEIILGEWERATREAVFNLADTDPTDQESLLKLLAETTRQDAETMTQLRPSAPEMWAPLLTEKIALANNIHRFTIARPPDMMALLTLMTPPTLSEPTLVTIPTVTPPNDPTPVIQAAPTNEGLLEAVLPVLFPPGTTFEHPFPLDGRHSQLACEDCHTRGIYSNLPNRCTDCHTSPHQDLFPAEECLFCHQTANWTPFLPADHPFPLIGAHLTVTCQGCHPADSFSGTPATCQGCHATDEPHNGIFGTQCEACHTAVVWAQAEFDHESLPVADCRACHTSGSPPDHYPGQCSNCHLSTETWTIIQFDHTGFTDCRTCHSSDGPPNHFPGQCSDCHTSTQDWPQVSFSHAGQTDCRACHTGDSPADHYPGQCSNCHLSTEIWTEIQFDHTGLTDCRACHSSDSPPNHFPGQCSDCHTSRQDWAQVFFSHADQTDCQVCHGSHSPPNHYPGQCSNCHLSTETWTEIQFDHTGFTDCRACHSSDSPPNHFPGQCSDCHTSTQHWSEIAFSHQGQTEDCEFCHARPRPKHYNGVCRQCHISTIDWKIYSFEHNGQEDCQFCHARPPNHFAGQCDACHVPGGSFSVANGAANP